MHLSNAKTTGLVLILAMPLVSLAQIQPAPQASGDARDRVYYPDDTENIVPLAKKLAGNVWLDQREIWASPFHMHRKDVKWWLGFSALTAALIATDPRTEHTFENSRGQVIWANRVSDIGSTYTLIPIVGGFYGLGVAFDDAKARETGVLGGEALLDGLILVEVLKTAAGRSRPNARNENAEFFTSGASFPSGHAIASWSLASVIAHEYGHKKWVPFVAYGLASLVSAARFGAQQHYASDIVAGGAMGWFIGTYVYRTHEDHGPHSHGLLHPQISPQIEPGSGTYALGLNFQLSDR